MDQDQPPPQAPPPESPQDALPEPTQYVCPNCSQTVSLPAAREVFITCPHCGQQFIADDEDDKEQQARDELEARQGAREDVSELEAIRIRQYAVLGRTAIRRRSYNVVGLVGCLVMAGDLIIEACHRIWLWRRFDLFSCGFFVLAVVGIMGAVHFLGRIRQINREIHATKLSDPETPPDLSTLSDGSQHWKNLRDM